ncbi:MAG: glycogen synthase [Patescibacteria group bacterium]
MDKSLRVLFLSAEVVPFAKTGGLADVAGALPKALRELGHDIRVCLPRYGFIDRDRFGLKKVLGPFPVPMNSGTEQAEIIGTELGRGVPVYLVENARFFGREGIYMYSDDADRFIFFCRAALEMTRHLDWRPDIIHCNDWHTALVPNWLRTIYRDDPFLGGAATVFTIHNLAYQGVFGHRVLEIAGLARYEFDVPPGLGLDHQVNFMGRGLYYADHVNAVSPTYAREILTPEYGEGFDWLLRDRRDRLHGILNGVDYEVLNPATDPHIAAHYDVNDPGPKRADKEALQAEAGLARTPDAPLVGMISRLSDQKGFDLLGQVAEAVLTHLDLQLVILGTGDERYHQLFTSLHERFPAKTAVFLTFNTPLAQRIYAGSDLFLMPSRFEPCGLGQLIALRYGSVPIVRRTGGLADTVSEYRPDLGTGNGFTFGPYDGMAMYTAIVRAVSNYAHRDAWRALVARCMSMDFSWRASAQKYEDLYHRALASRREQPAPEQFSDVPG